MWVRYTKPDDLGQIWGGLLVRILARLNEQGHMTLYQNLSESWGAQPGPPRGSACVGSMTGHAGGDRRRLKWDEDVHGSLHGSRFKISFTLGLNVVQVVRPLFDAPLQGARLQLQLVHGTAGVQHRLAIKRRQAGGS